MVDKLIPGIFFVLALFVDAGWNDAIYEAKHESTLKR